MAELPVHWGEGLFLRPQHFQLTERHLREQIRLAEDWNVGYSYGIHKIEIDEEALANWRIVIRSAQVRLHDGSHLRFGTANNEPAGDCTLDALPLSPDAFAKPDDRVRIYLGVPELTLGRRNTSINGRSEQIRFFVDNQQVEDENEPGKEQSLQVRWQNAQLIVGKENTAGYSALPIMQLKRGATVDAPPEIDPEYFPPLLNCSAWKHLNGDIIERIYDYLSAEAEHEAKRMIDGEVAFSSGHREDFERIQRLHSFNTALGAMSNLPFLSGLHPLPAYLELCKIVGLFSIFDPQQRRMPAVPRYDHDNLQPCFYAVMQLIFALSRRDRERYQRRDFHWDARQMRVRLEQEWLSDKWKFFIGVQSELKLHEVDALFRGGGQAGSLHLKVGPSADVDMWFERGVRDINLVPEPHAPRELPAGNWTYWRLDKDSNGPGWQKVEASHELGIRFRDHDVKDRIDGDRTVRITKKNGELLSLSFALFAMPAERVS